MPDHEAKDNKKGCTNDQGLEEDQPVETAYTEHSSKQNVREPVVGCPGCIGRGERKRIFYGDLSGLKDQLAGL